MRASWQGPRTGVRVALDCPTTMEKEQSQAVQQLLDMQALGAYLGRPWRSLERQLQRPPEGFPPAIKLGRRVFWSRQRVDAWLRGEVPAADFPPPPPEPKRGRGRPPKQPMGAKV
jgi:predicted DNA-binding transcriptional regulator AlpA